MTSRYPLYPVPAASALVQHKGAVLLLQRRLAPGIGQWSLPGGKIELGETAPQAAAREVWEECGIKIAAAKLLDAVDVIIRDEQQKIKFHYIIMVYGARYLDGTPTNSPESFQVSWIPLAQALSYNLTATARQILVTFGGA